MKDVGFAHKKEEVNMNEQIYQLVNVALPIVLGYIVWLLQEQKKEQQRQKDNNDANAKGTMLLLRAQLISDHKKWMESGTVTKYGLENFLEMYDAYHALGGNGMVTHLKEEIQQLPILTEG